jgi:hypothetical protein
MRNVFYHYNNSVAVHIRSLTGELVPSGAAGLPVFDDKNSFTLRMAGAEIAITPVSLANVLNERVFAAHDAPIKDLSIGIEKGKLKVKGKLHNKGDVGFETTGAISVTDDGRIRLHAEKVRALHLPVKGLMDLFGIDIADLVKTGKVRGVEAEKDDLLIDASQILPPPRIEGKVSAVRLENNQIVQVFGKPARASAALAQAGNGMLYSGNQLRFGKLTMTDTDMVLIDMDPRDPFDFNLDRYKEQLSAGYTRITPAFGLRVYMRDVSKLPARPGKTVKPQNR